MLITSKLEIDLQQPGFKQVAYAVQNDSNTRALEVSLLLGGAVWSIPSGTTAAVSFRKMDLTSGLYDTLPDGSTKAVTFSGNTLTAILAPQVLTCAGKVDVSIALYDPNKNRLGVFPVLLYVSADPSAGNSLSNDYYYLTDFEGVNKAIGDLNGLKTSTKENLVQALNELAEALLVDPTLTLGNVAADAKATGIAISKVSSQFTGLFEPVYAESDETPDDGNNDAIVGTPGVVVELARYAKETNSDGQAMIRRSSTNQWLCVGVNTKPNTSYRFEAIGPHNRFQIYGTKEYINLEAAQNAGTGTSYIVETILVDNSLSKYTFNSGDYQTVFLYLVGGVVLDGSVSAAIYDLSDNSGAAGPDSVEPERLPVGYKAKLPIELLSPETLITLDDTLSVTGKAADAKATGDAIAKVSEQFTGLFEPVYEYPDDGESGIEGVTIKLQYYAKDTKAGKDVIGRYSSANYACFGANTKENTLYKFTASGPYNRFRLYGTTEEIDLEDAQSADYGRVYYVEPIYVDDDTVTEYTFNSGNYRTVFLYSASNIAIDGISASIYDLSSSESGEPEPVLTKYKAKFPIEMGLSEPPASVSPSVTSGAYKWLGFHPWIVSEVPSTAEEAAYGYEDFINNVYEPLRAEYPSYITRSVIGRDASDTYDIYQYTLCPDYPEQTIYLQSGVHGNEPDAWIGLANTIRAICNDWASHPGLAYLRWACRICIIPIVNPYGMQKRTRRNSTNTDVNRDTVKRSQSETIAVCNYFEEMNELHGFNFALDYHTTAMDVAWGGDCAIGIHEDSKSIDIVKRVGIMFAKRFSHDRLQSYLTAYGLGKEDLYLPYFCKNETDGTFEDLFYLHSVPGSTVEWSDGIYATTQTTEFTMKGATELIGTQIIQHAEAKFGILS